MKFISLVLFALCSALLSVHQTVVFASDFQLYPFQSYQGDIYKFYVVNWMHYVNQTKSNTNDLLKLIELNSDSTSDGDKKTFENIKIKLENLERKVINEYNKVFLNGLTQLTKSLRRIHGGHVKVCNVMEIINRGDGDGGEKCLKLNDFCKLESIEDGLVQCVKSFLLENFNGLLEYTFALASFYDEYTTGSVNDSTLYDFFDEVKSSSNLIHKSFLECTIDAEHEDEQQLQIIEIEEKSCFKQS